MGEEERVKVVASGEEEKRIGNEAGVEAW